MLVKIIRIQNYSLKRMKGENIMEQSEYKIGGTTYIVVTTFNVDGESLAELIARLIEKSIWLYKNVWTNSGIRAII